MWVSDIELVLEDVDARERTKGRALRDNSLISRKGCWGIRKTANVTTNVPAGKWVVIRLGSNTLFLGNPRGISGWDDICASPIGTSSTSTVKPSVSKRVIGTTGRAS